MNWPEQKGDDKAVVQRQRTPCLLEALTPVHIGSGMTWKQGFDFVADAEGTRVVPEWQIVAYLKEHPERIPDLNNATKREDLLWDIPGAIDYELQVQSQDLLSFIRDGNGLPFIPGSSLKGAIRTAFLRHFVNQQTDKQGYLRGKIGRQRKKESAASDLTKDIFGKEPKEDLLRAIIPTDAQVAADSLSVRRLLVLNLTNASGTSFGWKNIPKRLNTHRIEDATPIYAEMLQPGSRAAFSLSVDDFLFSKRADRFLNLSRKRFSVEDIARRANRHARNILGGELDFFERLDSSQELEHLIDNTTHVRDQIPDEGAPGEHEYFLLRVG